MSKSDFMKVDRNSCMYCGTCVGTCRENAITLYETRIEFGDKCTNCGVCVRVCPVGAITKDENKKHK